MKQFFADELFKIAKNDRNIFLLIADVGFPYFKRFEEELPDQFLNVGIAEQNLIGIASGLALKGKTVFVYGIISFILYRAFDQIRLDLDSMNLKVALVGAGAGEQYIKEGISHYANEDLALMSSLDHLRVFTPSSREELKFSIKSFLKKKTPSYIRLPKYEFESKSKNEKNDDFKSKLVSSKKNLCLGHGDAMQRAQIFARAKNMAISSIYEFKPLSTKKIKAILKDYDKIFIFEDHKKTGSLYLKLLDFIQRQKIKKEILSK